MRELEPTLDYEVVDPDDGFGVFEVFEERARGQRSIVRPTSASQPNGPAADPTLTMPLRRPWRATDSAGGFACEAAPPGRRVAWWRALVEGPPVLSGFVLGFMAGFVPAALTMPTLAAGAFAWATAAPSASEGEVARPPSPPDMLAPGLQPPQRGRTRRGSTSGANAMDHADSSSGVDRSGIAHRGGSVK